MYNFLKIGAFIMAGRFLKPRLKGLLILIAFWFIVRFLHAEYLRYVELSGDTDYLIAAALIKITLYIAAFGIYVLITERKILRRSAAEIKDRQDKERQGGHEEDDGFDAIRHKKKLLTPAEQLLGKD